MLRRSHAAVLAFLAERRDRLLDLATGAAGAAEEEIALDTVLLRMCGRDAEWRGQLLAVDVVRCGDAQLMSATDTLPAGVLLAPLQSNYAPLLGLLSRLIEQVAGSSVTPIDRVFKQMVALPLWSRVDTSALHALPSE